MPTLTEELTGDPLNLGYAPLMAKAADSAVAALLNATSGSGTGTVSLPSMPKADLLLALIPAVATLASKSAEIQSKWDRFLSIMRAVDTVRIGSPAVQALFAVAVQDGLLTEEQANAIGKRTGSRAEVLWGAGIVITAEQVGAAR